MLQRGSSGPEFPEIRGKIFRGRMDLIVYRISDHGEVAKSNVNIRMFTVAVMVYIVVQELKGKNG